MYMRITILDTWRRTNAVNSALGGGRRGRGIMEFKVILGYISSLKPSWDTEESVSKQTEKKKSREQQQQKTKQTNTDTKERDRKRKEKRGACIV